MKGAKTGGRTAGTPNRSTAEVKAFLDRVFTRAFTETLKVMRDGAEVEISFEDVLVAQILSMTIDAKLLQFLLTMYAGSPARQVDVNHKGTVTLAQLIAGTARVDEDEPELPAAPPASTSTEIH